MSEGTAVGPAANAATKKKLSLICFSGNFDTTVAAFTLATGAAAVNYEVNMFFTFWGLNILKNGRGRKPVGRGPMARAFNFMMGGFEHLPMTRLNFAGASPGIMTRLMKKRNVATVRELYDAAKALGVRMYACEMSMNILGLKKENFTPEVRDVVGVAGFLNLAEGGQTLFI